MLSFQNILTNPIISQIDFYDVINLELYWTESREKVTRINNMVTKGQMILQTIL